MLNKKLVKEEKEKAYMSFLAGSHVLAQLGKEMPLGFFTPDGDYTQLARLMARLYLAVSYDKSSLFEADPKKRLDFFNKELDHAELQIKVNENGWISTGFTKWQEPNAYYQSRKVDDEELDNVRYSQLGHNTYICIRKLNIYLNADVVQQLNINPQQVINTIQNQLMTEINRIEESIECIDDKPK